jgi:cyclohexa-1,5-dienecarbonyl-CoA hydratase
MASAGRVSAGASAGAAGAHVRVEFAGDGVVKLVLDRPPLNVLDVAMLVELRDAIQQAAGAPGAKLLLLAGAGKAFCAGVDVADHTPERVPAMLEAFHGALNALAAVELPVVAAVHGAALGGGMELLLACDAVLVREDAKLGQPEIRLGVFPPYAAVVLPRLIGRQRALDLILSGRVVDGREAVVLGLATQALAAEDFDAGVGRYVAGIASLSGAVLRLTKRAVRSLMVQPAAAALASAERIYLDELMRLEDAREGLAAFMEKRPPAWKEA